MGKFLEPLFDSIVQSKFADSVEEILFVCEKSNDGSEEIIANLAKKTTLPKVRMIQPDVRRGLFYARYLGAKAATTQKIFFIDSRITLPPKTGQALHQLGQTYPAMSANVDIDVAKNIYCLYWQRSHESIFRKTYRANQGIVTVTDKNFDQHRIGGTCFYCSRDLFIQLSQPYLDKPLHSDDTLLMKEISRTEPFTVHPDFRIMWEPRDTWKVFLKHLYQRGPGFAEYHIFTRRGWMFYAVMIGILGLISLFLLLFIQPLLALATLAAALLLMILSTALFAKNLKEFILLAPLHVGSLLNYGFGAIRGIYVIYNKRRNSSIS